MKRIIQLILFIFLILIIFVFYKTYFTEVKKTETEINQKDQINSDNKIKSEDGNNLIKNLKYNVKFDNNSQYFITAELSELVYVDNIEIVKMQLVTARFIDENNIPLIIKSKEAVYNNNSYDTKFSQDITIKYMENSINSDNLYLNFTNNIVTIYNNVVYEGLQGLFRADNVVIDLVTKDIEIFMNNSKNKVSGISN